MNQKIKTTSLKAIIMGAVFATPFVAMAESPVDPVDPQTIRVLYAISVLIFYSFLLLGIVLGILYFVKNRSKKTRVATLVYSLISFAVAILVLWFVGVLK